MADIKFIDHTEEIQSIIAECVYAALEEASGELESQVKRNTVVDTGQTKNSWTHRVTGSMMAGEYQAQVGSPMGNAIWEEFGTGDYALNGNGRKGGWFYEDEEGIGHFTHGKQPRRPFYKAYTAKKNAMINMIRRKIQGGFS